MMSECTHMHLDEVKKLAADKNYIGLIVCASFSL